MRSYGGKPICLGSPFNTIEGTKTTISSIDAYLRPKLTTTKPNALNPQLIILLSASVRLILAVSRDPQVTPAIIVAIKISMIDLRRPFSSLVQPR
jgi:hypothetical protein